MPQLIPDDPTQKRALLIAAMLLAGLYVANEFWLGPKRDTLATEQADLDRLETNNRQAQIMATRGGQELEERMAAYERHIAQLEQLIPAREQVSQLLNDVTIEARQTGVELDLLRPDLPEQAGSYVRDTYEVRVIGEYHDFARFLTQIASMERIITPVDMDLQRFNDIRPGYDFDSPVIATFRIQTYVIPDAGELPAGSPSGGDR